MIFHNLKTEKIVQTFDKTRLDATRTFLSNNDSLVRMQIDPEGSGMFYDVTTDKFLDYQFSVDGTYTPVLRVESEDQVATDFSLPTIEVVTPAQDNLFSGDEDLIAYEDNILRYIRKGRNSFLDKHREAQKFIMDELARGGILDRYCKEYDKNEIVNTETLNSWSTVLTLKLIFESLNNSNEDIFRDKVEEYKTLAAQKKSRVELKLSLDRDDDGVADEERRHGVFSSELRKRG